MATKAEKVSKSWRNIVSKSWRKIVEDLTTERNQFRDELTALQKRISEAPKQKVFYDDDGNIVFVESIMGEPLRLDSYDVFTVVLVRIEGEKA